MPQAVDTNGAGDTFATVYMLAAMRGDPSPGSTASWAASRAVLQPQTCKPRCAPQLITAPTGNSVPRLGQLERACIAAVPLLQHLAGTAAGMLEQAAGWAGGVQVGLLDDAAGWLRAFSHSSSWGRDISRGLAVASDAGATAAAGSDSSSTSSSSKGGAAAAVSID